MGALLFSRWSQRGRCYFNRPSAPRPAQNTAAGKVNAGLSAGDLESFFSVEEALLREETCRYANAQVREAYWRLIISLAFPLL
jgi:hypothetical protein